MLRLPESSRWAPLFGAAVLAIITLAVVYSAVDSARDRDQEAKAHAVERRTNDDERRKLLTSIRRLEVKNERLAQYLVEERGVDLPPDLAPAGTSSARDDDDDGSVDVTVRRGRNSPQPAPTPSQRPSERSDPPSASPAPKVVPDVPTVPLPEPAGRATDDVKDMVDDLVPMQ